MKINILAGQILHLQTQTDTQESKLSSAFDYTVRDWEYILVQIPCQYYIPSNSLFHTLLPNLIFKDLHNPFTSFWILASILPLLLAIQPTLKYLCALH